MERIERAVRQHDPAEDQAIALLRGLDALHTNEPKLADPFERLMARLIDLAVELAALVVAGVAAITAVTLTGHGIDPESATPVDASYVAFSVATDIAIVAACLCYELGLFGRSLGKRITGLSIVGESGAPASRGQLASRALAWMVPSAAALWWWSLTWPGPASIWPFSLVVGVVTSVLVTMLRDDAKRGWHDRIAGTIVVTPR